MSTPAIHIRVDLPTREDNIDTARRDRAMLLAEVLWAAGCKPGDPISPRAWGEAEQAAKITPTSEQTRAYTLQLLACKTRGVEPFVVAGRHYEVPAEFQDAGRMVDKIVRDSMTRNPALDEEQAAVLLCIALVKNARPLQEKMVDSSCNDIERDVLSALVNMKVKLALATACVQKAKEEVGADNFDSLFTRAVQYAKTK